MPSTPKVKQVAVVALVAMCSVLVAEISPAQATSAIQFVKEIGSATRTSYTTSNQLTLVVPGAAVSQGNTVIITAESSSLGVTAVSATDGRGNIYTVDARKANSGTSTATSVVSAYMATPLQAGDVITISFSDRASILSALATEWSGIAASGRVDGTAAAQGSTVNLSSSAAPATTAANDLLIGSFAGSTNTTFSPGAGFTAFPTQLNASLGSTYRPQWQEYRVVSSVGVYTATGTQGAAASSAAVLAAYKADSGPPDTTPPTQPTNLAQAAAAGTTVTFGWGSATDNVGVAGYGVYNGPTFLGSTQNTSYTLTNLSCGQTYSAGVDAYDAAGNRSPQAAIIVTTSSCPPPDTTPPTVTANTPSTGATGVSTGSTVTATFGEAVDPITVTATSFELLDATGHSVGATVSLDGSTNTATLRPSASLSPTATYTGIVHGGQVKDLAGNALAVDYSWSFATASALISDTTPPTTPNGFAVGSIAQYSATLTWTASTDNVGVVGYDVYENDGGGTATLLDGRVAGTSVNLVDLACGSPYVFYVDAVDAAGNRSPQASISPTTPFCSRNVPAPTVCPVQRIAGQPLPPPPDRAVTAPVIPSSPDDFTPVHPFVFMTTSDISALQNNVNVLRLPWAVALYGRAKADADANMVGCAKYDSSLNLTQTVGTHMLAATLVYLVGGDPRYADAATSWLLAYAKAGTRFQTSFAGLDGLNGWSMQLAWSYDLLYNYLAANRPTDLAVITNWLTYYMNSMFGAFSINTGFNGILGKAVLGYTLGKGSVVDSVASQFQSWYSTMPGGYFGDFGSGQAFKNYDITLEPLVDYAITTHRAVQRGYAAFDALTWKTSQGYNLIHDHVRQMAKYATPTFQVPFQATWRGPLFWLPDGSSVFQELYAVTHDSEWGTIVAANQTRDLNQAVEGDWETIDTWPGLMFGREVDNGTGIGNDSFDDTGRGFAVMNSGDPNGTTTSDTLQAFLMHGSYGAVEPLNLKLAGKGQKLTQEHDTDPTNIFGERGGGGIYVRPVPAQKLPPDNSTADSSSILLWDVNPHIKIIGADYSGLGATVLPNYARRTVAVTSDYFLDIYDVNQLGNSIYTYVADGVGPSGTYATLNGTDVPRPLGVSTNANFTVTWPNHMRMTMLNSVPSQVTLNSYGDLPPQISYTTDPIQQLGVRRAGVAAGTKFVAVYEPFGQGGSPRISAVQSISPDAGAVTALKIVAADYTDYIAYESTVGSYTVGNAPESLGLSGRYGFVRYTQADHQVVVDGTVTRFTIAAATVSRVCVGGLTVTYDTSSGYVTFPGTAQGVAGASCR